MKRLKSDYTIQTVTNALRLLEAFDENEELGVTELSRRLDLHKNNVFRLLATLHERNYVDQCENEQYRLGSGCLELGRSFTRGLSLLRAARPILEQLVPEVGETVHIAQLQGFEVLHLDAETSEGLVVAGSRVGQKLPAYCTALGKILLAQGSAELRQTYDGKVVQAGGLEQRTAETITDRNKFFEHLRSVALEELAFDFEECEAGLNCIAAPVYDDKETVVAAISLSGPSFRLSEAALRNRLAPHLRRSAEELSNRLGYPGSEGHHV
ncbi:IclR family transcriptional regulator [Myxococcota bacterium]|nr:IclR family transcriptional regulator [Myxococcota bacterium]